MSVSTISKDWPLVFNRIESLLKNPLQFDLTETYKVFWGRIFVKKQGEFLQTIGYAPTRMWESTVLGTEISMRKQGRDTIIIRAKWYAVDLEQEHGDIWGATGYEVNAMAISFAAVAENYRLRLVTAPDTQNNPGWQIP
jgi:hypothetical protein